MTRFAKVCATAGVMIAVALSASSAGAFTPITPKTPPTVKTPKVKVQPVSPQAGGGVTTQGSGIDQNGIVANSVGGGRYTPGASSANPGISAKSATDLANRGLAPSSNGNCCK